jgi:hypothetical protein
MNTHVINKQIIDLKVNSEEDAFGLQQQVTDAYMTNVLPLIGELLDELAGPGEVLRIDRLELDFGMLHPDKIGMQMKERIREALLKQFPKLNRNSSGKEKQDFSIIETVTNGKKNKAALMSEGFSQRELLQAFFETGILPWWATDEIAAPDIDEIVVDLFEKEPATTLQWLQQLAIKSPPAIRRMMMQVEKTTYNRILASFPEKIITAIRSVSKQLQQVQSNFNNFLLQDEQNDQVLFSALILPPEILHANVERTNQLVLETLINQVSIVYQTVRPVIEKQLYAKTVSEIISSPAKISAAPDLVEYFSEWEKKNPEIASSVTGSDLPAIEIFSEGSHVDIGKWVDAIEQALKEFEEKQPVFKRRKKVILAKKKTEPEKETAGEENIEEQGQVVDEALQNKEIVEEDETNLPENKKQSNEPTDDLVKERSKNKIADLIDESGNEIITETGAEEPVKINFYKAKDEHSIPEKIEPGEEKFLFKDEPVIPAKKIEEEQPVMNETKTKPIEQEIFFSDNNDEADFLSEEHPLFQKKPSAGMTRFGGIILIAPFLPAFFSELKLIDDGKFIGEAEQYKALHLLNYIGSGKTSSPEYALMLHKLLCGIELTTPVPKTIKLSAAEKKEALLFLDDIAGQWTALRSTSGKAFRDTFFRRNGILEKKDTVWLLRVERGPMDIMLDTLPWTISIIRAPWMQQLLQVEW